VWLRDLGRCAFVGTTGHRCNERRFVEFHHVDPYALGGEATVDGIQLRCRRHNDYEGRLYFEERRQTGCASTTTASSASAGVSTDVAGAGVSKNVAGAASELVPEQVRLSGPRSTI
jgi:vancomycin resistance protein YoaR